MRDADSGPSERQPMAATLTNVRFRKRCHARKPSDTTERGRRPILPYSLSYPPSLALTHRSTGQPMRRLCGVGRSDPWRAAYFSVYLNATPVDPGAVPGYVSGGHAGVGLTLRLILLGLVRRTVGRAAGNEARGLPIIHQETTPP